VYIAPQEHAQELAWQLSEAQRHTGEAKRERDQLKMEIEQDLQAVKDAKVRTHHHIAVKPCLPDPLAN